ncbi:kinase-like domain-containing protein [Gigaspora margarita]|uniref:Kinase-like domain-containing protein n=1 Tax=Gigaspora margarita TaxID=4874 RepID=A0A8H4EPN0_GIGMA|nr:kinase-like domain-containing protein [Gigaspora margarita]
MLLDSTSGQQYNNSETTAPQSIDNLSKRKFLDQISIKIRKIFIPDLLYLSNEGMLQDEYVPCPDCNHLNAYENWCQPCNAKRFLEKFSSWTSENKFIDTFIHTNQINAMIWLCWDMDPSRRPTAKELLSNIYNCWENYDKNIEDIKNDTIKQAIIQFRNADIEIQSPNLQEDFTMRTINIFDIIAEYEENEEKNNNIICEAPMEQDDNN